MGTRTIIIGAGLGGLATAVRLARAGHRVLVLEKNGRVGGRCNYFESDGYRFDTGPTLLLMRDVLDSFFASAERRLDDYLDLVRMRPNYRIHFGDGSHITFSDDQDTVAAEAERFQVGGASAYRRYIQDAGYKYRVARERFVERNFYKLGDFATPANLYYLLATTTLRKLDRHARRYFSDPRLVAAFTFQTMYLGLSPSAAPSVYSLLPYTELEEGIWFPRGGMYRLVDAIQRVAYECGVEIVTNAQVDEIVVRDGRAIGVRVGPDIMGADIVVSNADLPYTYEQLLPMRARGRVLAARFSHLNHGSSAYMLFIGAPHKDPEAMHHTVYLASDITGNYRAIFEERRLPLDPSLYVCVASRTDSSLAPSHGDTIYVLVPVSHIADGIDWRREEPQMRQRVLARLETLGFSHLENAAVIRACTPPDLAAQYNLARGSAFGLSHEFWQVGYMRPANRAPGLESMYFVGASTVPGGGVPMVVIGSRLTAERILHDERAKVRHG